MRTHFIKGPAVKRFLAEKGRRTGHSVLPLLDDFIRRKLEEAAKQHNGGKITIDAEVLGFVGVKP